mmetsp:Transcript_41430/g.111262  ORF Transcript_41430/g.111262 Transcript_41430/m.111262 type:complete len:201 (+) Transcript_41430:1-603(+)
MLERQGEAILIPDGGLADPPPGADRPVAAEGGAHATVSEHPLGSFHWEHVWHPQVLACCAVLYLAGRRARLESDRLLRRRVLAAGEPGGEGPMGAAVQQAGHRLECLPPGCACRSLRNLPRGAAEFPHAGRRHRAAALGAARGHDVHGRPRRVGPIRGGAGGGAGTSWRSFVWRPGRAWHQRRRKEPAGRRRRRRRAGPV